MAMSRWQPPGGRWILGVVAGLIVALCPVLGGRSNGEEPAAQATRAGALVQPPRISVQHGQLSVSLRSADVRQVIAEIGQLAGIPVILGGGPKRKVSAEFTDVALEEGLRRLLRLAALNHTILFAQGPAGELTITKVIIFGTEPGGVPLASTAAEADREESTAADPAAGALMTHLQEAFARGRAPQPSPVEGKEGEAVRRVRAAINQAIDAQAASSPPQTAEDIIARIPATLDGDAPWDRGAGH